MIRNLSMKIGEVDSNLAEPESTSSIFMLKFLIIWSLLEGEKVVDILLVDLLPVELIAESDTWCRLYYFRPRYC